MLPLLDFVNTEIMQQGQRMDLINDSNHLLQWLWEASLVTDIEAGEVKADWHLHPTKATEAVQGVRRFRVLARQIAQEIVDMGRIAPTTLEELNGYLRLRSGIHQLQSDDKGAFTEVFLVPSSTPTTTDLLGRLAQSASSLLCHADLSLVRRCENPNCILYFYDATKNHTRRWCSMSGCGNRAKAAAHYQKRKQVRASTPD